MEKLHISKNGVGGGFKAPPQPNPAVKLQPPTVVELESAMRAMVDAIVRHRQTWNPPRRPFQLTPLSAFTRTDDLTLRARSIAADPLGYTVKRGIKALGMVVLGLYGQRALNDMAERVYATGIGGFHTRVALVNSALDGVGNWCA
jgi:hypothetical protein